MSKWITRRDLEEHAVGRSMLCVQPGSITAQLGMRTIEECIAILVAPDEVCEGVSDRRPIKKNGKLVGHIVISDDSA